MRPINEEVGMSSVIYHCEGCRKTAESSADLLRQGCEGTHTPYVPQAERDEARAEVAELREALERIATAAEDDYFCTKCGFSGPLDPPGLHPNCNYAAGRRLLHPELANIARQALEGER